MSTPLDLDALERTVRKTSTATGQWRRIYANDVPSLIAEIRDLRRRVAVYEAQTKPAVRVKCPRCLGNGSVQSTARKDQRYVRCIDCPECDGDGLVTGAAK